MEKDQESPKVSQQRRLENELDQIEKKFHESFENV